jgi:hypothetical protein
MEFSFECEPVKTVSAWGGRNYSPIAGIYKLFSSPAEKAPNNDQSGRILEK